MSEDTVTFVNVLEVEPERQEELVALLTEAVEQVIRHRPGFLSTVLYASVDGRRVINHTSWRAAEDAAATQNDPDAAAYARQVSRIATATPGLYRVAGRTEVGR
ncbi:antibiotic biosynthesis monooxygenase [Actinoalloteichus sp. AHMU CJ021]|uniref:Antibiotic biosynthesis monooxygenase n=1 Tax=Actinoalloteichus caeruleus DSM 43889 TaxID=1120930 RepID=A0ABT1JM16_ACTCY|nr:antibiotic biosynthesis monooxygenase [Actinoalloteichus caeruleus]AUS79286.1 antibiotic biosynthesis monooxygenase [Actinoalloteichus sp. AHMU CJ021]MCP2333558.1 Antibiotic biosynthesis monooxygenase [Actinoalloteichus caeruleus DSM 43889]